jgi:hypothetical protein
VGGARPYPTTDRCVAHPSDITSPKEQFMNRSYRTRQASGIPGWGTAPGWAQSLPGWSPLVDHGPLPGRGAGSVARWWWPTLALGGFGAVVGFVLGHDYRSPSLSTRGLITVTLAALVVVLLTIHRAAGPRALARAAVEYAVVAALAGLLTAGAGGVDQQPASPTTSSARVEAKHVPTARPKVEAGQDRPGMIRVAARVGRAVTRAIRAVTGAARWLVDLWRQADAQTDHPTESPQATAPKPQAMPFSPAAPSSTRRPL